MTQHLQGGPSAQVLYELLEKRFGIERTSPRAALALSQFREGLDLNLCLENANKAELAARELWRERSLKPFCEKHGITEAQAISIAFQDSVYSRDRPHEKQVCLGDLSWGGQGEAFAMQLARNRNELLGYEVELVRSDEGNVRVCNPGEPAEFFAIYRRVGAQGDATAEHVEDFESLSEAKAVASFLCRKENVPLLRCPSSVNVPGGVPRCVIGMEGGVFVGATANCDVELLVFDYSTEGASPDEIHLVPSLDGEGEVSALSPIIHAAVVSEKLANECFERFARAEPRFELAP